MEDDYFAMYPDAGKKYLLLEVNIMNTGSEPVEVNSLPGADAFTVRLKRILRQLPSRRF